LATDSNGPANESGGNLPLSPTAVRLLTWVSDDYIELYGVQELIRQVSGSISPDALRQVSLDTIADLLASGLIFVGEMKAGVADLSPLSLELGDHDTNVAELAVLWPPETSPEMGHGPWLAATQQGKVRARRLNS
jgi:hypothetical protein